MLGMGAVGKVVRGARIVVPGVGGVGVGVRGRGGMIGIDLGVLSCLVLKERLSVLRDSWEGDAAHHIRSSCNAFDTLRWGYGRRNGKAANRTALRRELADVSVRPPGAKGKRHVGILLW